MKVSGPTGYALSVVALRLSAGNLSASPPPVYAGVYVARPWAR